MQEVGNDELGLRSEHVTAQSFMDLAGLVPGSPIGERVLRDVWRKPGTN
jgi:hypothetical protein